MQHRGEIVKKAVYQSGYSITKLAAKIGKSRRWVYLMFDNSNVSLDMIIRIGTIIHYDFSDDIRELKHKSVKAFGEGVRSHYGNEEETIDYWKDKYLKLLEEHTQLLKGKKK